MSLLRRRTPLARGVIKRRKRKPSETLRVYGPPERRAWVKRQPCVVCVAIHPIFALVKRESHNAHTETGGMGRKADYTTIVPLCASHHKRYDEHQAPCDDPKVRAFVKKCAEFTERAWQAYTAHQRNARA